MEKRLVSRLKESYYKEITKSMMEKFNFTNVHQVPKLTKIVLSMGLGKRDVKKNVDDLTLLAGQKSVITKAKKSVSQFSVRKGFDSGCMVTLRGNNMYHFLDRLLNIALLNWRSYQGVLPRSVSKMKYVTVSLGIPDKRIFPEVVTDSLKSEGLNITICSDATDKNEFIFLLESFGFPMVGK